MDVDTGLLHSGANQSHRAGGHAQEAANHLSRGPVMSGMFGEFAAAESFHEAVTSAQAHHVKTLQAHQETLTAVGANAHTAANGFTDMEERNAAQLRAVRPGSAT
jgi:alanine racemase